MESTLLVYPPLIHLLMVSYLSPRTYGECRIDMWTRQFRFFLIPNDLNRLVLDNTNTSPDDRPITMAAGTTQELVPAV